MKMSISAPGIEIKLPAGTPWYGWVLVIAVVAVLPFVIEFWFKSRRTAKKVESVQETMGAVHEQVANTHSTNLRSDIDGVQGTLNSVQEAVTKLSEASVRMEAQSQVTATAVGFLTEDARHTRRDLAEIRADRRVDSEKIDRIGEQFANHLNEGK